MAMGVPNIVTAIGIDIKHANGIDLPLSATLKCKRGGPNIGLVCVIYE
jgi:hypothetical protein